VAPNHQEGASGLAGLEWAHCPSVLDLGQVAAGLVEAACLHLQDSTAQAGDAAGGVTPLIVTYTLLTADTWSKHVVTGKQSRAWGLTAMRLMHTGLILVDN
jgi:hypothetical protein